MPFNVNFEASPGKVNFNEFYKPVIRSISAGAFHSGFIDDLGRLFTCGKNDCGQLGLKSFSAEHFPQIVNA